MEKIGILGGAFDPPHLEHILIAKYAMAEFGYSKVIFLPSFNPPHKILVSSVRDRLAMLELVVPTENICDIEIGQPEITYTVNMIPRLKEIYGENIELIVGGDSMRDFHLWHRPLDILKQVKIVVACRDYQTADIENAIVRYDNAKKVGIEIMKYQPRTMSSSRIRDDIRLGYDVSEFIDASVNDHIINNNLYNEYAGIISRLKEMLSPNTIKHSLSTCRFALRYVNRLKLDYNEVFLASVLHDCAKCLGDYTNFDIPEDSKNTSIAHAFAGMIVARDMFGITNENILNAIYYHTTGRANMTALEKLIYCADMLEDNRDFEGIDILRKAFDKDIDVGVKMCLESCLLHLRGISKDIYPITLEAWEYYKN